MAITRQPEQPLYKSLTAGAFSLGKALPRGKAAFKRADIVDRAKGVPAAVQRATQPAPSVSGTALERLKGLGALTTPYKGSTRYEPGGRHLGVDIAAKTGTPVGAFTPGKVTAVRTGQKWTPQTPSFGNYVIVTDPQGKQHRYSHLHQSYVPLGATVKAGETIGTIGKTGSTYSRYGAAGDPSHLDYRIFDAAKRYYDPFKYLATQ